MQEKANFILDIKRLGINGEGIGFYNKMAVFVPNAIPGEGHDVVVEKIDGSMAFAKSIAIKTVSKDRVKPSCPHYETCGRCEVSHISSDFALKLKRDLIIEAFNRYSKLNCKSFEIKQTQKTKEFGYQNNLTVSISEGKAYLADSTIPVEDCLVISKETSTLAVEVNNLIQSYGLPKYVAKFRRGVIKGFEINRNLLILNCCDKNPKLRNLALDLIKIKSCLSVYERFEDKTLNHLSGVHFPTYHFNSICISYGANSNLIGNDEFYKLVVKAAKLSKKESILTNSIELGSVVSFNAKSVLAVANEKPDNDIANLKIVKGNLGTAWQQVNKDNNFDILLVDGKRYHMSLELLAKINGSSFKRIVYTNYNPSALAKDVGTLAQTYQVRYVAPVDISPQKAICAAVVLLERRKEDVNT